MKKLIIYPNDISVSIVVPTGDLSIEDVAKKDVPFGVPYLFVYDYDLPDISTHENWKFDFSNPHGYGLGYEEWHNQNNNLGY